MLGIDSRNQIYNGSYAKKKNICTIVQREVNMSNLHNNEEKEMEKLFHVKIKFKKTMVDAYLMLVYMATSYQRIW